MARSGRAAKVGYGRESRAERTRAYLSHRMRALRFLFCLAMPAGLSAQTTYLPLGSEDYPLLDRMEVRSGHLSSEFFTTIKPVSRKGYVSFLEELRVIDSFEQAGQDAVADPRERYRGAAFTPIDRYNVNHAISVSGEWAGGGTADGAIPSERPVLRRFYRWQPDLFRVNNEDFFLSVNPVIGGRVTVERSDIDVSGASGAPTNTRVLTANTRGVEVRARIKDRIGLYTFFTDNQEEPPGFVNRWIQSHSAVLGADYYQTPAAGKYDYLVARGYVDVAAVKNHVNVTFGYDKHFIGDGIRSLFLSDFASTGAAFLRINTRIWRLNYQNLYLELTPQYARGADRVLPNKYATVHHLSVNATRWLNIGLYEAVVFSRPNAYEFSYLNPVILLRQVERLNGSPDNAMLGLNFKAIAARHLQFYGQVLFDEFKFSELAAGDGWWGNKFGLQAGAKYFDVAGVRNLDLQLEANLVRPFTYTHYDTIANWTHYNQPLAHPLGAGFGEIIGVVRYQPVRNLYLNLRGTIYSRGVDVGGLNYGNNIFRSYNDGRAGEYGYNLFSGTEARTQLVSLNTSYELFENLFLDLGATYRNSKPTSFTPANPAVVSTTTVYGYGGLRLNLARRDYDFY